MRLSQILTESDNEHWKELWYDSRWGDISVKPLHDPIKTFYGELFEDAFERFFPKPIKDYEEAENVLHVGGNTIFDAIDYQDLTWFEIYLKTEHPSPDKMYAEIKRVGEQLTALYELLRSNDPVIDAINALIKDGGTSVIKNNKNRAKIDHLVKTVKTIKIDDVELTPIVPYKPEVNSLNGSFKTKYVTRAFFFRHTFSDESLVMFWKALVHGEPLHAIHGDKVEFTATTGLCHGEVKPHAS